LARQKRRELAALQKGGVVAFDDKNTGASILAGGAGSLAPGRAGFLKSQRVRAESPAQNMPVKKAPAKRNTGEKSAGVPMLPRRWRS
jgi:hypothetical protein